MEELEKITNHLSSVIMHLNNHLQTMQNFSNNIRKPIQVSVEGDYYRLMEDFKSKMNAYIFELKHLDIGQALSEIKYIGKRLDGIERSISEMQGKGINKNIELSFNVDGYQLVKKPVGYDPKEPIQEPNEALKQLIDTLDPRFANVVIHRLGLFGEKKKTYDELGKFLGVTRERVRQIYSKSLRLLRHPTRKDILDKVTNKELLKELK